MSDNPETTAASISRNDLLSAIDSEIQQRESSLSHHGINVWGIGAAIVALLWAAVNEAIQTTHTLSQTVLVFYAGQLALGSLMGSFTGNLGKLLVLPQPYSREVSFRRLLMQTGIDPKIILDFIAESLGLLAVSIYLCVHGFRLLGFLGVLFYLFVFLMLLFAWILCRLSAPLPARTVTKDRKWLTRAMVWSFVGFLALSEIVVFSEVWRAWPNIAKSDIRLGVILAALLVFFGFARRFAYPPRDLYALRALRTRLAFGLIDVAAGKREAEDLLLGPPKNHYLLVKADAAIAALNERIRICEELAKSNEWLISIADRLKAAPSDKALQSEAASQYAKVFRKMLEAVKAQEIQLQNAKTQSSQLKTRTEFAKGLLDISPGEVEEIMNSVRDTGKASDEAMRRFRDRMDTGREACKWLYEYMKDASLPKPAAWTRRELLTALFDE